LGGNALECFGFDAAVMADIAARIGPAPADVLGSHDVDAALIEHFDLRSGYSKAPVVVDPDVLATALDEEIAGLVASA
jgi:hypothetical protein